MRTMPAGMMIKLDSFVGSLVRYFYADFFAFIVSVLVVCVCVCVCVRVGGVYVCVGVCTCDILCVRV